MYQRKTALLSALTLTFASTAFAQADDQAALKAAVQKAINANPEVTARFNAYRASADAVDIARAGYYPRLDLSASGGRDRDRIDNRNPETQSLNRAGASLTLSQLLWDGLATKNDVGRLGHERLARYFEVVDITEQTALEAARAYYDVLRFRKLVQLAEENFVQHQTAYNQIQSRFKAGVGRGVDLEQAAARVALAESNLNTEISNLYDVSSRYQRLVGEVPPASLPLPAETFRNGLPGNANDAANEAIRRSPSISASIENLRSAEQLVSVRESAFQPRVEARLRGGAGKNFDGVANQRNDSTAEVVLNWNLFNGGADRARVRQQTNLVSQATDLRDKACRDVRQTVAIAYNDTRKLVDQLVYLDRNTLAITKARDAYHQQFNIGQRSLLDLLNSENEVYTAQRSYVNAEYDLSIAYLRTHAATNQLISRLGVGRDAAPPAPDDAEGWSAGNDAPGRCPAEAVATMTMDSTALRQRAAAATPPSPVLPAASAPTGAAATGAAATAATAVPLQRVTEWAAAWQARDINAYLAFYAPTFMPEGASLDRWRAQRRSMLARPGEIAVLIANPVATAIDAATVETRFRQTFRSNQLTDITDKVLTWRLIDGKWLILRESGR